MSARFKSVISNAAYASHGKQYEIRALPAREFGNQSTDPHRRFDGIDRSFVVGMTASSAGLAAVSTIINLAHWLKLKVVAEGVETDEQQRLLRLLNCDEMQGYLFSKPVPSEIFEQRFLALGPLVTNDDDTMISSA